MKMKWSFLVVGIFCNALVSAQCLSGDCINGQGVFKYASGALYEGKFSNGKIADFGTLFFSNGNVYKGNWKNQYREGNGELKYANGDHYQGGFQKGRFQGKGVMNFNNGDKYQGEWQQDKMHGDGVYAYNNGDRYEGDFYDGNIHGYGTMFYYTGSRYEGNWVENLKEGEGTYYKANGQKIAGHWNNGKLASKTSTNHTTTYTAPSPSISSPTVNSGINRDCNNQICYEGVGKFVYSDGSKWIGEFRAGKPEGKGKCLYANGDKYEGGWEKHAPHGEGVMYYANGKVYGAKWHYGRPLKELNHKPTKFTEEKVRVDENSEVKVWAVVVGVAGYTHMPALKYTDDDAYQIYAFLKSPEGGALPDPQIKVLVDDLATRENIIKAMNQTFLKADENDVVLMYFSGHGLPGSFLPYDYDGYRNKLLHTEIQQLFDRSKAKHKICFADACHSGTMLASKAPSRRTIANYYSAFGDTYGGTALLLSSKGDEFSLEDLGLRQGIFSHFLIKGLKGEADKDHNGIVTVTELYHFVHKSVTRYTNYVQNPTLSGKFDPNMPVAAIR